MFPLYIDSLYDLRAIARQPLILPGDPEPAWLRQRVAYRAAFPSRNPFVWFSTRPRAGAPGIVQKLRLALARG